MCARLKSGAVIHVPPCHLPQQAAEAPTQQDLVGSTVMADGRLVIQLDGATNIVCEQE